MANENNNNQGAAAAENAQPKIVGMGKPILVQNQQKQTEENKTDGNASAAAEGAAAGGNQSSASTDASQAAAGAAGAAGAVTEPSEEQVRSFFEKQGIEWKGIDDAKEKFKKKEQAEPEHELTDAEKQQIALTRDKKRLDSYLKKGGTIEQYAAIKAVAEKDLTELSKQETKRELLGAGFSDAEADKLIRERYYQLSEDEIEMLDDETEKQFAKRKQEYFTGRLANEASSLQGNAKKILGELDAEIDAEIEAEKTQQQNEIATSSKVDEYISALPSELTFNLGEVDDQPLDPIKYTVDKAQVSEILSDLKDPQKRQKLLYNEDGSFNITSVAEGMFYKAIATSLAKAAALEGGTREVKKLQQVFPNRNAHDVGLRGANGVGGENTKQAGRIVSVGKPQVVRRG